MLYSRVPAPSERDGAAVGSENGSEQVASGDEAEEDGTVDVEVEEEESEEEGESENEEVTTIYTCFDLGNRE